MTKKNKKLASLKGKSFLAAAIAVSIGVFSAPISANANSYDWNKSSDIKSPEELLRWQSQMSRASDSDKENLIAQDMKLQAMYNYAKTVAIRAAMTARLNQMANVISKHSRELDAIYNFQPLMIQQRVVPPVITEARNLYNQDGKLQIRLSDAIFNIEEQARFSSTAPNWRSYLNFQNTGNAYQKLTYVAGDMEPKNKLEERVWIDGTKEGWALGVRQSNVVLEQAMNRLNRDYIGMVRFHQMVLEGKITMPSINSYNLYDNNEGDRLILGEELLQIDVLPTFKNAINLGNGIKNSIAEKLSMTDNRIETPLALESAPTKEVYKVVSTIRNGQDITDQPWKDALPLAQTENALERPAYISVDMTKKYAPVEVATQPETEETQQNEDVYLQEQSVPNQVEEVTPKKIPVIKRTTIIESTTTPDGVSNMLPPKSTLDSSSLQR